MRRLSTSTALFWALTLLPASILAWLGWQASAPLVDDLQRTTRAQAERAAGDLLALLPGAVDALLADKRAQLAAAANAAIARLPTNPAGQVLRDLEPLVPDAALLVLRADGSHFLPAAPATIALPHLPEWREFVRWRQDTGPEPRFTSPALQVLAQALRADTTQATSWAWPDIVAAGPLPMQLLARHHPARLRDAHAGGWLFATPATETARLAWLQTAGASEPELARQRLRCRHERGSPSPTIAAPLPAGMQLRALLDGHRLAARLPVRPVAEMTFALAATDQVPATAWQDDVLQTGADSAIGPLALSVTPTGLRTLAERSRRQRWITGAGIGLLLASIVLGTTLVRAALRREQAARQLRDDFIANVSHELRTPLTSVRLYTAMLARDGLPAGDRRQYGEIAEAEAARLSALVDDLLDFAALERGRRRLEPEPVDLAAATQALAAVWQPQARVAGTELRCDVAAGTQALVDPTALLRILTNLLQNASRHGHPARDGGQGRIRLQVGPGPTIEVRDNGPGVPVAARERIFERFERLAADRPGQGLGLALSRELARACGGDLQVDDDGRETIFRLTLAPVPASALP